jgi:hypothetical protein
MSQMKYLAGLLILLSSLAAARTLTLTGNSYTVHQGDPAPPCTFTAVDSSGPYVWGNAVASGYPVCSTTYTPTSSKGTYAYKIAAGTMTPQSSYSFAFVAGTINVIAPTGVGQRNPIVPLQPVGMMQNVTNALGTCTGMVGDGVTLNIVANTINCMEQTARKANGTYGAAPKQFYFPPGKYLIDDQILALGSAVTFTGAGPTRSIIKLQASAPGFTNPAVFKDVVYFQGANGFDGYNEHFENIGIEIGPGNPGSNALQFIGNNFDAIKNVTIAYDDSVGKAAFAFTRAWPGQTLAKNIAGYGAQFCVLANGHAQYSLTVDNITCQNQTVAAITNGSYNISMSGLFAVNDPIVWPNIEGAAVLLTAEAIGPGSGNALTNGSSGVFEVRNFKQTGYTNTMVDSNGSTTITSNIVEHTSGTPQTLFGTSPTSIVIGPVPATPDATETLSKGVLQGCALGPDPTTWTATAAGCAYPTVYVPVLHNYPNNTVDTTHDANHTGFYTPTTAGSFTLILGCNINHFMGNGFTFARKYSLNIVSNGTTCNSTPLVIDHFTSTLTGPTLNQNSARPVVFEDTLLFYNCTTGAGPLFLEDIELGAATTNFCSGQNIWARSLDDEAEGSILAVNNVAYVSATQTLTLTLNVDPGMIVGSLLYFRGLSPSGWLNGTSGVVTNISGSTVTATLYGGAHEDQPATAQTGGNYRVQFDRIVCTGCNLWWLGYKTERIGSVVNITNGNVEGHGGFYLPVRTAVAGWPLFKITNSNAFFTGSTSQANTWQNWVTETRGATTRSLPNPGAAGSKRNNLNMFYSNGSAAAMSRRPASDK